MGNDLREFWVEIGPRGALRLEHTRCGVTVQSGSTRRLLAALVSAANHHKCQADDTSNQATLFDTVDTSH